MWPLWVPRLICRLANVERRGDLKRFGPRSAFPLGRGDSPWTSSCGDVNFLRDLTIVDYGDAPIDLQSQERTFPAVRQMVVEIAETGTIPVIVGGDHSLMYPDVVAITDVYGKGKVGVVHFDAHFDGEEGFFGHYISHGSPVRLLLDEGHVKGKNFVQVGLHSVSPGREAMDWMRGHQVRYHTMAEILKKGWDDVMKEVLAEALDGPGAVVPQH